MKSPPEREAPASGPRRRWLGDPRREPGWLGLGVVVVWLLVVAVTHVVATLAIGPRSLPFGPARYAWNVLVNAVLLGLVVGGHAALERGVAEDLRALQPILPASGESHESRVRRFRAQPRHVGLLAMIVGLLCGLGVATLDPRLRSLYGHLAFFDPRYVTFVAQNLLFSVGLARLFATEIHLTRAYARLGQRVTVDLIDPSAVLAFGRKGLRSVTIWVSISTVFSMFWVLDSAGRLNPVLAICVLGLATIALVAPTIGARRSIAIAKARELAIIGKTIRNEREGLLSPRRAGPESGDGRLGSLIQYQAFVKSVREWPFDLSTVSRSLLFIALGVGSWLGGAVVERLLNRLLG